MVVNPKIKLLFAEIATKSQDLANKKDEHRKYINKLVKLYTTKMSEEEQIFIATMLFEQLHFKNIVVDPETMVAMNNVKHRTYFIIFALMSLTMVIGAGLFKTNSSLNDLLDVSDKILKMLAF